MFEKFMSSNAGDFRQRYRGTYGFFITAAKRTLVMLSDVSTENRSVHFSDSRGVTYQLNVDADDDIGFEFIPPRSAWHNTSKGPMLVGRVAARQYQRGICQANTSIRDIHGRNMGVSFETLAPIFDGREITPAKASEKGMFAINPHFAVATDIGGVFLYNQRIGAVEKKDDHFIVKLEKDSMFAVELGDAFRRASIKVEFQ